MDFSNDLLLCKHHIQKVHSSIFLYLVLYNYMQVWPNYRHDYIITWVNLNDSFPANTHTRTIWHVFSFSFTTFNPGFPSGLDLLHFRLWSTPCSLPPPTDCGLLSLDRKKTTMATVGWWIKALIGKGESLWLRTRMYSTRTRSDSVTRFLKKRRKRSASRGDAAFFLCVTVLAFVLTHTQTHTRAPSNCHSLSSAGGNKHGAHSLGQHCSIYRAQTQSFPPAPPSSMLISTVWSHSTFITLWLIH